MDTRDAADGGDALADCDVERVSAQPLKPMTNAPATQVIMVTLRTVRRVSAKCRAKRLPFFRTTT